MISVRYVRGFFCRFQEESETSDESVPLILMEEYTITDTITESNGGFEII